MNFIYNFPVKFNIPSIPFKANIANRVKTQPIIDGFATNPIYDNLCSKTEIETKIKNNPKIKAFFEKYNLPVKINMEELENLKQGHLKETRLITAQIYSSLPAETKKDINLTELQQAAMLHDYGKILIPNNILNKKGRLTEKEREIMEHHSELGYELLKDKGLSEKTLNLIKYHHQNKNGSGYPKLENNSKISLDLQILNTADKFSALREKRCYKNPMAKYEALQIIANDVNAGNLSQDVYTALIKSV